MFKLVSVVGIVQNNKDGELFSFTKGKYVRVDLTTHFTKKPFDIHDYIKFIIDFDSVLQIDV